MPYTLLHDGVMREFDFYAPIGWEKWVGEVWRLDSRVGLPLVVALHGGGQDPLEFQRAWFFPDAWKGGALQRRPEDQFFVLYPYGLGWTTADLALNAYQDVALPGLSFLLGGEKPVRGWNPGFTGTYPATQDVDFIRAAMSAMEEKLKEALQNAVNLVPEDFPWGQTLSVSGSEFVSPGLFDKERQFVFGYSQGAMMAYRLVARMPEQWAAIWAMSGTCGGRPHFGEVEEGTVFNLPDDDSEFTVSLFAHHGVADLTVPPGDWGQADDLLEHGEEKLLETDPDSTYEAYEKAGLPFGTLFVDLMPGFLPLASAARGYREFNDLEDTGAAALRFPSVRGTAPPQLPLLLPWDPTPPPPLLEPPPPMESWVRIWPDNPSWNQNNPEVVVYRDPNLGHTGFTSDPDRYFTVEDVWEFFSAHPRTVPR